MAASGFDPAKFAEAYAVGERIIENIVDLVKNGKAEVGVLGLLIASAMLRRKTKLTIEDLVDRLRAADGIVALSSMLKIKK